MINLVVEYIKYCLKSKRRHGIHSPFVYDFGDKCLRTPISPLVWEQYIVLKQQFYNSNKTIEVNDLGMGSKKLLNERPIGRIAMVSGINNKYGRLLYRLVAHYEVKHALELGTSLGLGTFLITSGNNEVKVTTVEGCENTLQFAKDNFPKSAIDRVEFVNSSFEEYLTTAKPEHKFDLVFVDGDHNSKSLERQLELLDPLTHDETIFILDDIRWTKDMLKGWNSIVESSDFHLTMDLFRIGIAMKRKHQEKEHFIVRY